MISKAKQMYTHDIIMFKLFEAIIFYYDNLTKSNMNDIFQLNISPDIIKHQITIKNNCKVDPKVFNI